MSDSRASPDEASAKSGNGGPAFRFAPGGPSRLAHRTSPLWLAALVHRLSGLALALFLPFHFLALGLALAGEARLETFLRWTDQPLVKASESILVGLVVVHMLGGLRLLALENLAWRDGQAGLALSALAAALVVALVFLVAVF